MAALEAQIAHAERKAKNAEGVIKSVGADIEKHEEKLEQQRADLAAVKKVADAAAEEQRLASEHTVSLSAESLEEYRALKAKAALEEHKRKFPQYAFRPLHTKGKAPVEKRKVREVELYYCNFRIQRFHNDCLGSQCGVAPTP